MIRRFTSSNFYLNVVSKNNEPPGSIGASPFSIPTHRILINEVGFYSLVFGSELPQAKEFRKWVFKDVLPQIRKTGSYSLDSGLLKLKDISSDDVLNMSEFEKKEFKNEMKRFHELLKDPEFQRKGRNGGSALWKKIREREELCEELKKKLAAIESILGE